MHVRCKATLLGLLSSCADVELALQSRECQISSLQCQLEQLRRHNTTLETELQQIHTHNTTLQFSIQEHEERKQAILARNHGYRRRMQEHKKALEEARSHMPINRELLETRELLRLLRGGGGGEADTLETDLHNECDAGGVDSSILMKVKSVEEKQAILRKERETHAQLRKDIEIQNKRFDAIVKRLRCQLSKAQFDQRDLISDIKRMERRVEELTAQLGEQEE
ncbi:coiled-coil domain-containing protein 122-like [Engraulis encrasicolus]|uniref:coiled-coil domain-containing protein 122-like n=1 Tax=Engraulis encrasicolus TaxID=184585 RepID=UPI002FCEDEAE